MAAMFHLNQAALLAVHLVVICPVLAEILEFFPDVNNSILVSSGNSVTFTCNISTNKPTQINWTKDKLLFAHNVLENKTFSNFTSDRVKIDVDFPSKLQISNAQHEDSGLYQCYVTDRKGLRSNRWNLIVAGTPPDVLLWYFLYTILPGVVLLLFGITAAVCLHRIRRARTSNKRRCDHRTLTCAEYRQTTSDALQVIGGNRTVVQGRTVTFNCELVDTTESLTQISWQRTTRVKTDNDFLTLMDPNGPVYLNGRDDRIKFIGSFNELNGSFQISNVSLLDEGIYTCIFSLFPSGSHNAHIHLDVLVPPVIRVKDNLPTLADKEVCIATCTAAGSKPPASVSWLTGSLAENLRSTANSTHHDDGKTTTVSYLFGVPAMGINQQVVHCVVTSPALSKDAEIPFTIQVYFAPKEVKIGENPEEDSFQCETDSNPKAEFNWTRVDQAWPQSGVRVEGGTLQFLTRSSDLNGLYQCTAFNPHGRSSSNIFRSVISESCIVCWTLLTLLIVLIVAAAVWHLYKSDKLPFLGSRRVPVTVREAEVINPDKAAFNEEHPLDEKQNYCHRKSLGTDFHMSHF